MATLTAGNQPLPRFLDKNIGDHVRSLEVFDYIDLVG